MTRLLTQLPLNRGEYHSGLRSRFQALGGHGYVMAKAATQAGDGLICVDEREAPTIWRCVQCHLLLPGFLLTEGFYPRPCMGRVRSLVAGGQKPTQNSVLHDQRSTP